VWVGQTDPAFKTLEPRWEGASFEVEIPKGRPGTLVVEVYDFDAASANDFLGQVTIEVEDTGKDGRDTAEQVEPTRHPLLSKSGRQRRGEITLLIESAEPTEWIPGDLKSMRAEMARIFKMRNDLSSPDDDETESSPASTLHAWDGPMSSGRGTAALLDRCLLPSARTTDESWGTLRGTLILSAVHALPLDLRCTHLGAHYIASNAP
jgi:hypothetical protein